MERSRLTLYVYLLLTPFMSALAPHEWAPLPLVFLALATPFIFLNTSLGLLGRSLARDTGYFLVFCLGCLAMAFSPSPIAQKNLNYTLAMGVCYLFFFVVVRCLLLSKEITWHTVGRAARVSLLFLATAVVLEFFLASFTGTYFSDLFPFAHDELNVANFVDDRFKRPRAFAAEPGFTSLAFECLWPLSLLGARLGSAFYARNVLFATGFFLLGSAAGFASLALAIVIWLLARRRWSTLLSIAAVVGTLTALTASTEVGAEILWELFGRKFSFPAIDAVDNESILTVLDRTSTYLVGLQLLAEYPGGIGWGSLAQMFASGFHLAGSGTLKGSGMLSLFLDIAVATGWLGLAAMLFFVGLRWRDALRSESAASGPVAIALISVTCHHILITELQFPFFWFALALTDRLVLAPGLAPSVNRHARTTPCFV